MGTLEPHGIGAWEAGSEDSGAGARGIELFETEVELGEKKMGSFWGLGSVWTRSRSQHGLGWEETSRVQPKDKCNTFRDPTPTFIKNPV